jgi:hypothetical protein
MTTDLVRGPFAAVQVPVGQLKRALELTTFHDLFAVGDLRPPARTPA